MSHAQAQFLGPCLFPAEARPAAGQLCRFGFLRTWHARAPTLLVNCLSVADTSNGGTEKAWAMVRTTSTGNRTARFHDGERSGMGLSLETTPWLGTRGGAKASAQRAAAGDELRHFPPRNPFLRTSVKYLLPGPRTRRLACFLQTRLLKSLSESQRFLNSMSKIQHSKFASAQGSPR